MPSDGYHWVRWLTAKILMPGCKSHLRTPEDQIPQARVVIKDSGSDPRPSEFTCERCSRALGRILSRRLSCHRSRYAAGDKALVQPSSHSFRRLKNGVAQDQSDPSKPDYLMTPFSAAKRRNVQHCHQGCPGTTYAEREWYPIRSQQIQVAPTWLACRAREHAVGHGTSAEASQVGENTDQTARLRQTPPKRLIQAPAAFALAITIAVAPRESSWLIFCARLRKS
jgi:hypothetical protein